MITATSQTTRSSAIQTSAARETSVMPRNNASLLPAPNPMSSAGLNDAMSMLLAAFAKQTDQQLKAGEARVDSAKRVSDAKHVELEEKFKQWEDDQHNPFKFLIDMFKVIAIALSAVASACTGGALSGLLAGAVALSVASMVVEKTQMFGPEASKWLSMGMSIVSSLVGAGANVAGVATATVDTLAKTVGQAANVVGGAVQVGSGIATGGNAVKDSDAINAQADMTEIRHSMSKMQKFIEMMIDGMKETEESHRNAVKTVAGAIETNNQASMAVAGMRV